MHAALFLIAVATAVYSAAAWPASQHTPHSESAQLANIAATSKTPIRTTGQWATALKVAIRQNWLRPTNMPEHGGCKLRMNLQGNGEVSDVQIIESCGSTAADASIVKAVLRASPLPVPDEPSVFRNVLIISFSTGKVVD